MNLALSISAVLIALSMTSHAALPPGYDSLRRMDAAFEALANGRKNPGDVIVAGATMAKAGILVDTGGAHCQVAITLIPPPNGMIGAAEYSGKVLKCSRYMNIRAPDVMKYEDAKPALEAVASKGKADLSFRVVGSPQGPKVRLNK